MAGTSVQQNDDVLRNPYGLRLIVCDNDGCLLPEEPELIEEGTMPGRLYSLAGVYFTDPSSIPDLSRRFLESSESVPAFFGCVLSDTRVKDLAQRIVDGSLPCELLDEW